MKVRELIESLLDYDMDSEIEVELNWNGQMEWKSFVIEESLVTKEVRLVVDLEDYSLVETTELEQMENRLEELEDEQ